MPATIHLVRHAQGLHNLSVANEQLPDPDLTDLGRAQCAALRRRFTEHERIAHVVASPMRRTLYTALLAFGSDDDDNDDGGSRGSRGPVIALPLIQEVSMAPCDTGSEPAALRREFGARVNLALAVPGWNVKRGDSPWAPDEARLEARALGARRWLRHLVAADGDGDDVHVVVVTHGVFLNFLTEDWEGVGPVLSTGWANAELRSFEFADASGEDDEAHLKETAQSRRKRRGSAPALSKEEQLELRAILLERIREAAETTEQEPPPVLLHAQPNGKAR